MNRDQEDAVIAQLIHERDEARHLVLDVFNQACQRRWDHLDDRAIYDHGCLSAYETAQYELLRWGLISEEQCSRK